MDPQRLRIVLASGLVVLSIALFLPGRLEAACPQTSPQIVQLYGTWFENCADSSPVGGFIALISDPAGVNSNGTDAVCESSTAPDGLGRPCPPGSGTQGDRQVVVQYDFGPDNWYGSLGCPIDNLQGGSPMIVQVVANNGSSAIVRTSYDLSLGGYIVDFASPYDEATGILSPLPCRSPSDQSVRVDHLAPSGGGTGYEVDLTVLLPTLESDCNPGTAGSTIPQCTNGVTDNPGVTRGRMFTRVASCHSVGELRSSSWTLSTVQPDSDGHAHLSLPIPSSGCLYIGTTYAYDGLEVPAIAGFQELPKNCIPESNCAGDITSMIRIDVPDPSIVWWASEWWVTSYNLYRGDLAVLKQTGVYTQNPATVPLAARSCDVASDAIRDDVALAPGQGVFYLLSGNFVDYGIYEGNLGTNSAGWLRPNTNPCH
jgi:hypothetical protein